MAIEAAASCESVSGYVATLLDVPDDEVPRDTSLFDLGLDSISLMRIVAHLRANAIEVTFEDLVANPTIAAWEKLATTLERSTVSAPPALPRPIAAEKLELTPVQQAYWIGRQDGQPLGGVGCHLYLELDGAGLEAGRLEDARRRLVARHPMLRARFLDDGLQEIIDDATNLPLSTTDLRGANPSEEAGQLTLTRERLSHERLAVDRGETLRLHLSLLSGNHTRLHLSVDLLVADVLSISIILHDLAFFYRGEGDLLSPLTADFGVHLEQATQDAAHAARRAERYWTDRLPTLPGGPTLPLACDPRDIDRPVFNRRQFRLNTADVERIESQCKSHGLTFAVVLATAFAEVLARWSESHRFLINLPLFNRITSVDAADGVVADFTSLVLLEVDCSDDLSFVQRARAVQSQLHRDISNAAYSGVNVLRDLARVDGTRSAPVVFACNLGRPFVDDVAEATFGQMGWAISQTPQVWLDHQTYPLRDGLLLNWDSVDALFPAGVLDEMFGCYERLVRSLVDTPWEAPPRFELPAAQTATRSEVNRTEGLSPCGQLHTAFFEQAVKAPDRVALLVGDRRVTYGQLRADALQIAGFLHGQGVQPGDLVAINLPKGYEQIAAVFGVLAGGGTYVPLSWKQPDARTHRICARAGTRFAITETDRCKSAAWPPGTAVMSISEALSGRPLGAPVAGGGDESAYIIFTSGSTGEPKGVEVTHRAALNTIVDVVSRFGITGNDRVLALSALEFDLSVFDIFGPLGIGAALVLITQQERRDPETWLHLVEQHRVSVWNSVPALLEMAVESAERLPRLQPLRIALISGDWIPLDLPRRVRAVSRRDLRFIAMGGATEAAIWSNWYEVEDVDPSWASIPYGYPLSNQRFRVVDPRGRDCPDFVAGELWIGGDGVALGYRGAPDLTDERFVKIGPDRWYRTGDRGRYWPDGRLEFLGRLDQQVKLRGHRIELGEIEAALERHPDVRRASAVVVGTGASRSLAAAVVLSQRAAAQRGAQITEELLDFMRGQLPDQMVPSHLAVLDALPLTANGKVDIAAVSLAAAQALSEFEVAIDPPAGITEEALAAMWSAALHAPVVNRRQSFFQLGGNSLQAVRLLTAVRQRFGTSLPLRSFLGDPTIAGIAKHLGAAIRQVDVEEGVL